MFLVGDPYKPSFATSKSWPGFRKIKNPMELPNHTVVPFFRIKKSSVPKILTASEGFSTKLNHIQVMKCLIWIMFKYWNLDLFEMIGIKLQENVPVNVFLNHHFFRGLQGSCIKTTHLKNTQIELPWGYLPCDFEDSKGFLSSSFELRKIPGLTFHWILVS